MFTAADEQPGAEAAAKLQLALYGVAAGVVIAAAAMPAARRAMKVNPTTALRGE